MLNFHLNGLLTPHHNIKSNLVELEDTFLIKIPSGRRGELFEKYLFYTNSLKTLCQNSTLTQWIDGSFVTKKHEPGDIDLVTFVDFSTTEKLENELDDYRYPLSESIFGIDGYIVDVYPIDHQNFFVYNADYLYWMDRFNKTRRNRAGHKLPKGFLEIII